MKYLTRSYVEWLGLREVPIDKGRDTRVYCCPDHDPRPARFVRGVQHGGRLYERERDGLAFVALARSPVEEMLAAARTTPSFREPEN